MSQTDTQTSRLLTSAALAALEIKKQPFDPAADHFKLFVDNALSDLLNQLQELLGDSDHLPVITGPMGAGKSSLLSLLINRTNDDVQYFIVDGNEHFSAHNVFAGMLEAFQQSAPDELQDCLDQLATQLRALEEQKLQAVILVDDAHNVPSAELYKLISGMLYMRDGSDLRSFRIALAAQPEFEEHLLSIVPTGTELSYTMLPLPRLDGEKTGLFLAHHLKQAGYFEPLPFDTLQLQDIRRAANGLPAQTCNAASQTLNTLFQPQSDTRTSRAPGAFLSRLRDRRVLSAIAALLIVLSLVMFGLPDTQDDTVATPETPPTNSLATVVTSQPLDLESLTPGASRLVLLSEVSTETQKAATAPVAPAQTPPSRPQQTKTPNPAPAPETKADKPARPASQPKPTVSAPPPPEQQPTTQRETSLPNPTEPPRAPPAPAPAPTAEPVPAPPLQPLGLQSPNWVLMQDPTRFTVQVIASSDRKEVERFLATHNLDGPNSIFAFKRGSETWYSLVHGLFTDIEHAQASIQKLPAAVRAKHPWIRQIRRIHDSLKTGT
ncbi:MAG TPA: hypothetical protein DD979_13730 [Gammaproteobacteria bacterium]|jgi:DamX protein|nr:hypothetical protein [Gammaproteobacteria bacterium]